MYLGLIQNIYKLYNYIMEIYTLLYILISLILTLFIIIHYKKGKQVKTEKIPNIIHFVFGLKEQTEDFLFPYYLSVLSAYKINRPKEIYFYYHFEPYGKWWEKLKTIPNIIFEKVPIPTHFGKKKIKHFAHKADKIRMEKLYEKGGIYMDIDTISVRPYKHLLNNDVVLGYEVPPNTICNAVMLTKPFSRFFKVWLDRYESEFKEDGWGEASIYLPAKIQKQYPQLVKVLPPDTFFRPYAFDGKKIFSDDYDIPNNLITLHLWESYTKDYLKNISDYQWIQENQNTLYSKIVRLNISESDI
tara:strand:+ start:4008 stop:4910 length:903 start_codon:yes stop_codon:yes gene_type:complete